MTDERQEQEQQIREDLESEGIDPTDDMVEDRYQEIKRKERKRERGSRK